MSGAMTLTQVIGGLASYPDTTFAIARIARSVRPPQPATCETATCVALEETMARLDDEEAAGQGVHARSSIVRRRSGGSVTCQPSRRLGDDSGRRLLTEALFEKVEVLGVKSATIHPTPEADAHGWSDAFGSEPLLLRVGAEELVLMVGARGFEPPTSASRTLRAAKLRHAPTETAAPGASGARSIAQGSADTVKRRTSGRGQARPTTDSRRTGSLSRRPR